VDDYIYLSIAGRGFPNDFTVGSYSFGAGVDVWTQPSTEQAGYPVLQPLVITLPSHSQDASKLLAEAATGQVLSQVTLVAQAPYLTNPPILTDSYLPELRRGGAADFRISQLRGRDASAKGSN
jgi:hypothetical protein